MVRRVTGRFTTLNLRFAALVAAILTYLAVASIAISGCASCRHGIADAPNVGRLKWENADHTVREEFYENGQRRVLCTEILLDGQGFKDGAELVWYQSGSLLSVGQYTAGKKCGLWAYFWETGRILGIGAYCDDEKFGIWREYNRAGNVSSVVVYRRDGWALHSEYSPSGSLSATGWMFEGMPRGIWVRYHLNGRIHSIESYSLAGLQESFQAWTDDGTPIREK